MALGANMTVLVGAGLFFAQTAQETINKRAKQSA